MRHPLLPHRADRLLPPRRPPPSTMRRPKSAQPRRLPPFTTRHPSLPHRATTPSTPACRFLLPFPSAPPASLCPTCAPPCSAPSHTHPRHSGRVVHSYRTSSFATANRGRSTKNRSATQRPPHAPPWICSMICSPSSWFLSGGRRTGSCATAAVLFSVGDRERHLGGLAMGHATPSTTSITSPAIPSSVPHTC